MGDEAKSDGRKELEAPGGGRSGTGSGWKPPSSGPGSAENIVRTERLLIFPDVLKAACYEEARSGPRSEDNGRGQEGKDSDV